MFSSDGERLLCSGGDQSSPGQVIGFAEEAAGALLNSGDGRIFQGIGFQTGQGQMMSQIVFHFLTGDAFQVTAGQDTGSQGMGSAKNELIHQGTLTGQDDGEVGFGVLVELGEGVEFGKDFQSQERGLINNQDGFSFFTFIKFADFLLDQAGQDGP